MDTIRQKFDRALGPPVHIEIVGPVTACIYRNAGEFIVVLLGSTAAAVGPKRWATLEEAQKEIDSLKKYMQSPGFQALVEDIKTTLAGD